MKKRVATRLVEMASVMFPETPILPSAADVLADERLVQEALEALPQLSHTIENVLASLPLDPNQAVVALGKMDAKSVYAVTTVITGSYFLAPEVQAGLARLG
ncbi:hypothetical protein [Pedococcus sp. P5_B7]